MIGAVEHKALAAALCEIVERLQQVPVKAKDMGSPPEILEGAMGRFMEIADGVMETCQ